MTNVFRRAVTTAGVLAAGAAATLAFTGTASAAPAAYFPFPSCHANWDYYNPDHSVEAVYNHSDGSLNFYLLYVYGHLPNPNNIKDSANWATCVPN